MKTSPRRPRSYEARPRYDVTTDPKEGGEQPPPPMKPRPRSLRAVLGAALSWALRPFVFLLETVWLWARKPITLLALAICGGVFVTLRMRPATVDGPALPMAGWKASAHPSSEMAHAAIDGDPQTQWTTQGGQGASDWFAVDMKRPQTFHQIVMDSGADEGAYPRGYAVYLSADGVRWGNSVSRGEGTGRITIITLGPHTARYIKVVQTHQDTPSLWTLSEFTVH